MNSPTNADLLADVLRLTELCGRQRVEIARLELESKYNILNWCGDCGGPISLCGPADSYGEPTEDCLACHLRAERDALQVDKDRLESELAEERRGRCLDAALVNAATQKDK